MASLNFNSVLRDEALGNINFGSDTFKVMLVTSAYTENKDTHTKRSDITNEVSGTGYTAGGNVVAATVSAVDTANDRVDITFAATSWPTSTITARKAIIYKSRGGAASSDELVMCIDFGTDQVSSSGTFSLGANVYRKQN